MARLILDTSVLVLGERRSVDPAELVTPEDDGAIAAITAAELIVGIELADGRHRRKRQNWLDAVLSILPIENYDPDVARNHGALIAHTRRVGRPRGAHDLIVAATAIARDREVVTADRRGFEGLPGVTVRA